MKNALRWALGIFLLASTLTLLAADAAKIPCIVYGDDQKETPWSPSGWMGNMKAIVMDLDCTDKPHAGKKCIKIAYNDKADWAGVVWQSPSDDWGDKDGGKNLTGATKLTFWAKGAKGGEKVKFGFGMIGADKKFPDSAKGEIKDLELKTEWTKYAIDLKDKDLTRIKTAFYWIVGGQGDNLLFYLDDIIYE